MMYSSWQRRGLVGKTSSARECMLEETVKSLVEKETKSEQN